MGKHRLEVARLYIGRAKMLNKDNLPEYGVYLETGLLRGAKCSIKSIPLLIPLFSYRAKASVQFQLNLQRYSKYDRT